MLASRSSGNDVVRRSWWIAYRSTSIVSWHNWEKVSIWMVLGSGETDRRKSRFNKEHMRRKEAAYDRDKNPEGKSRSFLAFPWLHGR